MSKENNAGSVFGAAFGGMSGVMMAVVFFFVLLAVTCGGCLTGCLLLTSSVGSVRDAAKQHVQDQKSAPSAETSSEPASPEDETANAIRSYRDAE